MGTAISLYAPVTIRSTHRVSQPPTERDTISVLVTLAHAASTSRPPATAATSRAATGTTPAEFLTAPSPPSRIEKGRSNPFKTPPSPLPNLPSGTDLDGQMQEKQ